MLPPRVRIHSAGCRANKSDEAVLRGALAAHGYTVVEEPPYDVVIFNACTVTASADQDAFRLIRRTHREYPLAHLVLVGCLAQAGSPDQLSSLPLTLIAGSFDKPQIVEKLDALLQRTPPLALQLDPLPDPGQHTRYFYKIQEGCNVRCAFCIIPDARGPSRSLDEAQVVYTIQQAVSRGFREVILAGIQLGAWGHDLPLDRHKKDRLAGLVRRILCETGVERLRLGSIEPWSVRPELMALFEREPRLLPSLHLPLQSGSETILRAMGRPLGAQAYAEKVATLLAYRPDLTLWVDVMAGFPGETAALFDESYRFLETLPFTRLHVFTYSERSGTPAIQLPGKVPMRERQERARRLEALSDVRFFQRLLSRVGSEDEILVEAGGRGHTRDNLPIRLIPHDAPALRGSIVRVCLYQLEGETLLARPLARASTADSILPQPALL